MTQNGLGDMHYQQVAEVYMEAFEHGDRGKQGKSEPNRAVAATWGIPQSTADRWVKVARDRGFLPPTVKGRPGIARCRGTCPVHCNGQEVHTRRLLYPVAEAAQLVGVHRTTLYARHQEGLIQLVRVGGRTYVSADELARYVGATEGVGNG